MRLGLACAGLLLMCPAPDGRTLPRPACGALFAAAHAPARTVRMCAAVAAAPALADLTVYELKVCSIATPVHPVVYPLLASPRPIPAGPIPIHSGHLKAICRAKGLKVGGRKVTLLDRIHEADEAAVIAAPLSSGGAIPIALSARPAFGSADDWGALSSPTFFQVFVDVGPGATRAERGSSTAAELSTYTSAAQVDVLSAEDTMELELAERRAQRRQRLQQYYVEEVDKISSGMGELSPGAVSADEMASRLYATPYPVEFERLQGRAGAGYALVMAAEEAVPIGGSGLSISYARPIADVPRLPSGAAVAGAALRLAWCREFSSSEGMGVLVDLATQSEFVVRRAQLRLSDEFSKEAGNRQSLPVESQCLYRGEFVEYELGQGERGAIVVCRVQGVHGWPLMCDAAYLFTLEVEAGTVSE
ncbi:hypothetical protein T492DRAFT_191395 [Pavlovales sp. CCMP2436]|nr:hypothetical protein T492DRAFT_191395 [Pavlovales sp. CCMP2436]